MTIPDYQTLMLPVLKACASGEAQNKQVVEQLSDQFGLSEEEREQLLPSGKQTTIANRISWAKGYLKQAGLVKYTRYGCFEITDAGRAVLAQNPGSIDVEFLSQFESFRDFRNRRSGADTAASPLETVPQSKTPDETLRDAHRQINQALSAELLDRVREAAPAFFENLIVELLLAMGYGGASEDAGRAIGGSGDGGVDGVIDQDPLGVDQIYVQAKRYQKGNNIGAGAIRDFFGALNLRKAQKGIFFTTSAFSAEATKTARDLGTRIVLIDGDQLAKLMVRYNIGCRDEEILYLKKIDEDFFD